MPGKKYRTTVTFNVQKTLYYDSEEELEKALEELEMGLSANWSAVNLEDEGEEEPNDGLASEEADLAVCPECGAQEGEPCEEGCLGPFEANASEEDLLYDPRGDD